jgi:hypothetical protein
VVVGPGAGREHEAAGEDGPRVGDDVDAVAGRPDALDGDLLSHLRPPSPGQRHVHGVRPSGRHQPAVGLVHRPRPRGEAELRPAGGHLGGVELAVLDARVAHGVDARVEVGGAGRPGQRQVHGSGADDELEARLVLDLAPGVVGGADQRRVVPLRVGLADHPRVVLGRTPVVAEAELVQAEHPPGAAARQPVQRRRPDAAAPDDDGVVALHGRPPRGSTSAGAVLTTSPVAADR